MIFQSIEQYRTSGFAPQVLIVGSGPAGITAARKLASRGVPVTILEAGAAEYTDESQDFYRGALDGDPYFDLDVTRLREFGGCSNHWAGWCRVLEKHDFEKRAHIPHSGWPISRADIDPYLNETREILGLRDWTADIRINDDIRQFEMIKSEAVRFREKFGPELEKSERIAVVLNTYATALIGDGQRINSVEVFSAGTPAGSLAAPVVVAATGGLENERLLLWSNERSNGGAVPHAAALGRYWMEHNHFLVGHALLFRDDAIAWDETGEAFLTVSPEAMARREIGNFGVRVVPMPYHGAKRLVASLACVAPRLTEMMSDSIGAHLSCSAQLHLAWEQAPDPDNRVTLSATERDAADVPRIELHWKKRAFEHHTMIEAMRLLGHCFASKGIGRVRFDDWVINEDGYPAELEIAGHHHMGGTRMGSDPAVSVVDAHQRVHGMQNLYVAGSSVFTTGGQCTPTTTITALSLRLGEHLAQAIGA